MASFTLDEALRATGAAVENSAPVVFADIVTLKKSEEFFNKYGKLSTFIGRFIPVIRHFISIPAGFSKMNYPAFAIFTFIGAGLWNCILALLGYMAHGQ